MGERESVDAPVPAPHETDDRRRDVVFCAMATSWVWLLPLAGLTAVLAYLTLALALKST